MPFQIVRNDITKMKTDVIVNAANTQLKYGSGVCGAIFNAAGKDRLIAECEKIGHCDIGSAVVTSGCDLCEYIIHTVGPVWKGGFFGEKAKLESCYKNVLKFAYELNAESIAIPLISSGVFGYPKDKAMKVAVETIVSSEYLAEMDIYLVLFDKNAVVRPPASAKRKWVQGKALVSPAGRPQTKQNLLYCIYHSKEVLLL